MAPINSNKNPNIPKKQTGTVPKFAPVMMQNNGSNGLARDLGIYSQSSLLLSPTSQQPLPQQQQQQQQQKSLLPAKSTASSNKSKSSASYRSGASRKNTEVVAPTRRELNDLNDYLLINSTNLDQDKQQNNNQSNGYSQIVGIGDSIDTSGQQQQQLQHQQQQQSQQSQQHLDSSCYDIENINFQENQRFCYPVRPIPRRSVNKKHLHQQNNLYGEQNLNISNTSSTSSSAAVGVVIPTTPGNPVGATSTTTSLIEDNYISGINNTSPVSSSTTYQNILCDPQQVTSANGNNNLINNSPIDTHGLFTWEERLNFIQHFLSVTSKSKSNQKGSINQYNMVNETGESKSDEIFVNSTSLEDVAQSESSDRANSVSSIHTLSGAEPSTPNYEELQQRLENSNRNIQNIKDQQQQLLRLQQAAKQHLSDMEELRNQTPIRFNGEANGNGGPPDYESVEQVHNDMAALVNRMKNLQTFIQNQNDLSASLGEDSPDLLAEQELLQRKLNELKSHRTEMRNLVDELQNINTSAEKTITQQQQGTENHQAENQNSKVGVNGGGAAAVAPSVPNRIVPIEYQRVVPIELVGSKKTEPSNRINVKQQNGHTDTEDDNDIDNDEMDPETANMIKQKVADINTMKQQLQRLKEMMETVRLIEEKNEGPSPKEIGREDIQSNISRNSSKAPIEVPTSMQRDFTNAVKKAYENHTDEQTAEEAAMSERVRLLHEMTDDLRNQAMSLTSERDRLKALREELKHRRDFEVNEKKNFNNKESENLTSFNNTLQHKGNNSRSEQSALEIEYEEKKKEFRRLCEQLQSEEDLNDDAATVTGNEDNEDLDEESNNQTIKQERNYFTSNWQRNATSTSCNSSVNQEKNCSTNSVGACATSTGVANVNVPNSLNRGKDSADSGAVDVHANGVAASIEAGSMQSGSSRSYSMPPPMRSINNPAWRKNSHDHGHLHGPQPVGCEHYGAWGPYPIYQNPYGHMQLNCGQSGNNAEYACTSHTWNNLGINTSSAANPNGMPNSNDPVLLQQFIQTQQMLINSVCQCNQMLWHQQREINNLNNTVVMLQERILNSTSDLQSLQGNTRSESVPPLPQNSNLYGIGMNRAQSDQPLHASATIPGPLYSTLQQQQQSLSTPISPNRHCHAFNYSTNNNFLQQHQRRHHIQNQTGGTTQQSVTSATSNLTSNYNYSQEHTTGNIYSNQPSQVPQSTSGNSGNHMAFNNGQPMNFLNNDPAHQNNHPAGPIFMHHHNNNIGGIGQHQHAGNINNSNSNLLHQNATNSPTSTTAALNNQVPPGTRANNYWDNFRSYSRQNLLSSNSCKSNEELNHQMQQQHQQHLQQQQVHQQQQQQQPFSFSHVNNSSAPYNLSPISSNNNINIQNECRPLSSVSVGGGLASATNLTLNVPNSSNANLATTNSNNLNPLNYENKYFHTFRNEFNSNNQQQTATSSVSPGPLQPLNLTSTSNTITNTTINPHSSLNVESGTNLANQNEPSASSVPFNNNINGIQHLEVNQGGSASSNLSVAHSDNVNENIFDFNSGVGSTYNNNVNINSNSNNINNNNNNAANVASIFGSPDFRNMNFNFGLHEPKKVPMKAACATSSKRLRHTSVASNNIINSSDIGSYGDNIIGNNYNSQSNHNILNQHNNDHHRYEEMNEGAVGFDETSEEIKRNLLVNALKSDKFTSKFFESLKEDVYRQAYAIIQEKQSDPQFLIQLFEEIKGAPAYDPLRNMLTQSFHNLNLSTSNQRNYQHRTNNDTESNDGDNEMENEESSPAVTAEAAVAAAVASAATSAGISNYYKVEVVNSPPNVINSQSHLKYAQQPNISADCLYQRNSVPNLSNSENADSKLLFLNSKDYKFPHDNSLLLSNNGVQQKNKSNDLRNERAANQQYLMRNYIEPRYSNDIPKKRPESHIINYTIFKIRKEIQKQQIDDATLLRIVKITIQTLEDAIANLQQPSPVLAASLRSLLYRIKLSTKEIFTKMKNYQNQEKDNFLANYQSYLNKLLIEDSNNINLAKPTRHFGEAGDLGSWQTATDNNQSQNKSSIIFNNHIQWNEAHYLPKQSVSYKSNISSVVGNEAKVMNNSDNQNTANEIFLNLNQQNVHTSHRHQQNQYQQHQHDIGSPCTSSNNIMNEDLAEADQICSSNNQVSIGNADKNVLENNNDRQSSNHGSNSPSIDGSCAGAVGYSNIQNSNDESELISNDKDIIANENLNNIESEENRQYNGNDIGEDSENNIIDCCDNDKVEDDQDFKGASSLTLNQNNEAQNISKTKDTKIFKTVNPSQGRSKRSKNNRKSDITVETSENLTEFNELNLNNPEEISTDNYTSNNKSINVINTGSNNTNNVTSGGTGNSVIVTSSGNTTNNACAYIFPMSIESDSMINNNLDSGYQSFPQPDSSSSLSNSHTESVESNGSSIEMATNNSNSAKRNSVP